MCKYSQNNEKKHESDVADLHSANQIVDEADIDPKLLMLLDQVCETGEDALPALKVYVDETRTETADEDTHPDAESALKAFKAQHAAAFENRKHSHMRRWGYRLCVVAAAIIVLNTLCVFAFGRSMYDYIAMWGTETFGYVMQQMHPEKYDPETYNNPNETYVGDLSELPIDEDSIPIGEIEPKPGYANIPDTDISATGLEKNESTWNKRHTVESFSILNADFIKVVKAFAISDPVTPTWIPDSFVIGSIYVTKNYLLDQIHLDAYYTNEKGTFTISIADVTEYGGLGNIEKDDRPVIQYTVNGVNWYIMHNLEYVVASAVVNQREVLFCGPVTVEEMKKIIDSVYEGE